MYSITTCTLDHRPVDLDHLRCLVRACGKQAARVAAARNLASGIVTKGRGVERARWLGMEKVLGGRMEGRVAFAGSVSAATAV